MLKGGYHWIDIKVKEFPIKNDPEIKESKVFFKKRKMLSKLYYKMCEKVARN